MNALLISLLALSLVIPTFGRDRTFRVLFLDAPASAPKQIHVFDGSAFQKIDLPKMNFSEVYTLPDGLLKLQFFESIPDSLENLPAAAPSVQIPESMTDFYLLVAPDRENQMLPIKVFPVSASDDALRSGQTLWFNMTHLHIAGKLGSQRLVLPPSGRKILDAPINDSEQYKVSVFFKQPGSEQVYPLVNTYWRHDPRSKSVAFVIPQQGKRTPRIMVFRDFR